ncbi:hypothetical protein DPMN_081041 [Dreissena polymorpha]|uniref:NACHT domain-containing protein n=2 Tax=Dreissena polymorpha TaxID=45954 RepID=A0A9D3Y895_DREPO|nr:hypothetical protein DPMN_081041 [Dreissena polymorpha]
MAAKEPFGKAETCNYIDTFVTNIWTSIWICAFIGLITYLTFKSFKKRQKVSKFNADSATINMTLEFKSTFNQFSETDHIRMTNESQNEKAEIYTKQIVEDTKIALAEHQQDCTLEVLSAIKNNNVSLSAEIKSIGTRLYESHKEYLMYTRQMALEQHQQDCTTEVLLTTNALRETMDAEKNEVINEIRILKQTEHPMATVRDDYSRQRDEFREQLIGFYRTTKITVSVSPLFEGRDKPIWNIFVQPILNYITIEKDGYRKKAGNAVQQYKDVFYSHGNLNRRVFVQGEPGMGKSTFLTKLALDWCEAVSMHNPEHKASFSDVATLNEFQFLFHISLRDAYGQREVIEMIKTQIIDLIYMGNKRKKTFKLLNQILERETCIVSMDGLNEWADPLNKYTVPVLANCYAKCVSLISSRPWRMADERIKDSEIDRLLEIQGITDPDKLTKQIINSLHSADQTTYTKFIEYVKARHLKPFLTSPWLQTLLISLWMNNKDWNGSLCEINCILLDLLFKKANAKEGYFRKGTTFTCLSNTSYIEPQNEILKALANAAFRFTFSSEKSLVFSKFELRNYMSEDQLKFCLDAGLLTVLCNSTVSLGSQLMSFPHETVQEFLAALHVANSKMGEIESLLIEHMYNVLEMSQIIIYLCGLDCGIANALINRLTDGDFFNDMNHAFSTYIAHFENIKLEAFNTDYKAIGNIQKSKDRWDNDSRILAVSFLFQRMMIAGFIEAKASGQMDICLKCRDFTFNTYLNESESNALCSLLMFNKSDVRTLILESDILQKSELLTVLQQSSHCLQRVKAKVVPAIHRAFNNLKLQELHLIGRLNVPSVFDMLTSMSNLRYLFIEDSTCNEEIPIPATLKYFDLKNITCSDVFLQKLLVQLSLLKQFKAVQFEMCNMNVSDCKRSIFQSDPLPIDMSHFYVTIKQSSIDMYSLLRCTPIVNMRLLTAVDAALASDILLVHSNLENLNLYGTYTGLCDLHLPASLHCVSLQTGECSSEWLCSLLIKLSELDHHVECELCNFVVQSRGEDCGTDSTIHVSDVRSKLLSCDMSNIEILVKNGIEELFEIFRDTSIGILDLINDDCVSHTSDILPTLSKLKELYLWGTYTGHCALQLPASLKCIMLLICKCSSEWLCSLLIKLSELDYPVDIVLLDIVVQSDGVDCDAHSNIRASDLRSKLVSRDMSNILICVGNGSKELCEIFRDTSIRVVHI